MPTSPDAPTRAPSSNSRRRGFHQGPRLSGALALVLVLAGLVGVVPAGASTYRASAADVTATLSYQGSYPTARHTTLTISRAGREVYHGAVRASLCGDLCWPAPTYGPGSANPLRVVGLRAGSPDVVLGLYSGGAHCCFVMEVFAPSSTSRYAMTEVDLGDPGGRLEVLPGSPFAAIVTADDAFAYAFTDFAASGLPLQILRFNGHGVTNVTRQYPSLLRADAAGWLAAFYAQASSHYRDSVGVIAAWAADQYLLGRARAADLFLGQQARAGHLNSLLNPAVHATVFVAHLETFLVRAGY